MGLFGGDVLVDARPHGLGRRDLLGGGVVSRDFFSSADVCEIEKMWSSEETWAQAEFGNAELGDARRTWRLVQLAETLGSNPSGSLPEATGDWATLKASYRFFDNDHIAESAILQSHVLSTYSRVRQSPLVLAVQDTSLLDFTSHPATTGMGPLASAYQHGLLMHSTLAITPEGVPLGILGQKVWARDTKICSEQGEYKRGKHKGKPIEDKESIKWIDGMDVTIAAREACPDTWVVGVGDREADVYDLFIYKRPDGVDILVRASWDRAVDEEEKYLWKAIATAPVAATITVKVPRRKGLPARKGQAARPEQPPREATLKVSYKLLKLRPPRARKSEHLPCVSVYVVWAVEATSPTEVAMFKEAGIEPVEWMLLTTVAVNSAEDALERLRWYTCRWGIEVWHKVLKSGCRIEAKQLETAQRLKRCLTLYSVIAWRIFFGVMLARVTPDVPCTVLLEEDEWRALYCKIHRRADPPAVPPTLKTALRWLASLGGFLGRKSDGDPGVTVLWKGFQHLVDLTSMYKIMSNCPPKNVGNG